MVEQHETLITINQGKGQRAPRTVSPVQLHLIGGTFFANWHLLSPIKCFVFVLVCACVRVYVCVWAVWNSSGLTFNLLLSEPSAISTHQEVIQVLVLLGLPEGWSATCSLIKLLLRLKIYILWFYQYQIDKCTSANSETSSRKCLTAVHCFHAD